MADLDCDLPMLPFEQILCNGWKYGGISAIAFQDDGETLADPTSDIEIAAAVVAGTIVIQQPVRGEEPEASAIKGINPNAAASASILDTYENTIVISDYHVTEANTAAWNLLQGATKKALLFYGRDHEVKYVDTPCTIEVVAPSTQEKSEKRFYKVTLTFTRKLLFATQVYPAPSTVFTATE